MTRLPSPSKRALYAASFHEQMGRVSRVGEAWLKVKDVIDMELKTS